MTVEFRDALTSEQSVIIEVIARRAFDPAASSMNLPMVRPLDGMPRSVAMVLTPVAGQEFSLADDSAYVELSLAEATASWTSELESTQWLDVAGNPAVLDGQRFVVFTDSPSDADQLMITTSRERILPMLAESRIATPKASADQLSSASSFGTGSTLSSVSKQLTADVTVETTVPEIREHPCVHHVKYALPALAAGAKLQFALSEPASFISWKGNGTSEPILISDRLLQIQLPDTGDSFDVDLEYRSPFSQTLLAGEAIIPLPQSTVIKSDVSWKITLPPSYRMIPSTTGTSCEQSSVSWTHRLIGPLSRISGRDLNSSVRTVDQQRGDLAEFAVLQTDTAVAGQNRFLTRNNNEHTRSVPFSVGVLKLQIWKEDTSCRVGWLLMIAGCMAIGVIRRIQPQHCTFILFACAVSSGLVSAIVPDAFAILGGGLFFGILCGMFLPEKLWNHRVTVVNRPIGSTHRAPVFAGAGILFASIGIWSSSYANAMQNNQPGGTTTSPAMKSSESSARYDALIPIRSKQATLNETPVAYVSPALLERWRSHRQAKQRSPDYLLRDAEYELTLNQRPFPRMSAVFDVVHLNPLARHINIPLGGIAIDGEDACTVNGQVATIIPLKTSRGVSIDLDSIIPPSLPMDETEGRFVTSEADGRDDRANVLRIMIDCRLRSHKNGDLHQVNVAIPPLLSTKAALQHDGNDADFPWIHRLGSESRNGADQPARIELGPVKSLQIDWRPHGSEPASEAFIPHVAMTNIVVHPQHLKATTCLAYVVKGPSGTGVTPSIVFSVPPYAQVNNVRAPGLQSWKMRYHDTEPVAVRLTFVEPLNIQTVIVECEYVLPATLSDGKVTIPSFFSNMGQETSGFPVHSLGLSAAAGFRIEHLPALHQSNQVVRLSPDQFTQDWAAEDNVRCDLAYSLKAPQPLGVKVAPILPECRASISEIVTINLQAWQWEADIDLTSQDTPDVLHRLTLNPDITITSASVTDGGADVLSRWTRTTDQEQLLLLLTNEVSGSQRIHLTGEFMVKMGEPAHLSDFAVENAVVSQHTLTLQLHSDLSVEAFDSLERPISLAEDEAGVVDDPGLLDQHTFDLLSDVAPASIRIDAAASEFSFERLVTVDTGQEGQWFLTTEFIFPMDRKLPRQIQVVVPREFAGVENGLKSSPQAEHSSLNDGRLMLTFRTTTPDFVARRVEIMLKTSPKQDSAWQIPQVKVLNGLPKDEWLVLMPYATHELRGQFSSIEAEKLPDRFILTNGIDAVDKAVFRSTHGDWTLIPRSLSGTNGVVRRLDTVIWDANSEELCGVTVADVSVRNLNQFAIALPRGLRVTYVDSRDVIDSPVMDDSVSELVVPVPEVAGDRDTSCLLKVGWTLPKTSFAMRYDIPLLRPKELPVIRQRMVFLGSGDSRYEATSSSIFLELAAVNLLSDQASKESSPFIRPLEAAGCFRSSNDASSILMATVEQNSSQQPEAVVSMWRLNKQFRRFLLVLLISILGLIMGWKTRLLHLLREQILRLSQSPYAGPTVLAVLIWISGPVVLGITLTLLCIAVWGRALWKAYGRTTDFEYSPITTS
ncbi:MAG: hypothetical protein KDA52_00795 [Planctomycetaceae bacterium]|nr:hypothetical protein [Planctomycetaceae bacterium]